MSMDKIINFISRGNAYQFGQPEFENNMNCFLTKISFADKPKTLALDVTVSIADWEKCVTGLKYSWKWFFHNVSKYVHLTHIIEMWFVARRQKPLLEILVYKSPKYPLQI